MKLRFRFPRRLALILAVAFIALAAYELIQRQRGLTKATELAQFGLWNRARDELAGYLTLHPGSAEARLLMAELWVNDDQLLSEDSVPQAISHLERIPDDSPLAVRARIQQAKLLFLVQHRPVAAEELLRHALQLEKDSLEVLLLLSKVMELTNRHDSTEGLFWRIYELSQPSDRALRLRDWYMSQFFPLTANVQLEQQMGFTPDVAGNVALEGLRYARFRETEPDEPLGRAALARWTRRSGKPAEAVDVLQRGDESLDNEMQDPFFVTTLVDSLIDLGEYEEAHRRFQQWPGEREGHDYWRLKAIILEEVAREYDQAIEAYDRALKLWPGPTDWRLMHRRANCLAKAGRRDEAVQARVEAERIADLMKDEVHKQLRHILGFLDNPNHLREMAEFYQKLGRTREADAWILETQGRVANGEE